MATSLSDFLALADELLTLPDDNLVNALIEEQEENHWTSTAVDYENDHKTFRKLPVYVQELVLNVLMFTLVGDEVIMEETEEILTKHLSISEKNYFTRKQANEAVHAETYIKMARVLESIDGLKQRYRDLFSSEVVYNKLIWLTENLKKNAESRFLSLATFALSEGVQFRGIFIVADYIRAYFGWAIPGFVAANGYIRADENKHTTSLAKLAVFDMFEEVTPESAEIIRTMAQGVSETELDVLKVCHEKALQASNKAGETIDFTLLNIESCKGFPFILSEEIMESLNVPHEKSGLTIPNWAKGLTSEKTNFYESETVTYSKLKKENVENLWWNQELISSYIEE